MRILPDIEKNASYQMALDEAILDLRVKNIVPDTLRFYKWKPPAVSIGYFQSVKHEVNPKYLRQNKIELVRRITGGGAVYHDKEITYSIVIHKNRINRKSILGSYKQICGAVIKGLRKLGVDARFAPINDILVKGRKISGNAQTRRGSIILQHGTILLDVEPEIMFSALNVSKEKISDKIIQNIEDRVVGLRELGFTDYQRIRNALLEGFKEIQKTEKGRLTEKERQKQKKLENKFKSEKWNQKR